MGKRCKIDDSVEIDISDNVTIGNNVGISDDVLILTHDHKPEDISKKWFAPIVIEDDVWIAARAIILASCNRIGRGSVVAAGSVVTHDVPDRTLVGGNPARVIREL